MLTNQICVCVCIYMCVYMYVYMYLISWSCALDNNVRISNLWRNDFSTHAKRQDSCFSTIKDLEVSINYLIGANSFSVRYHPSLLVKTGAQRFHKEKYRWMKAQVKFVMGMISSIGSTNAAKKKKQTDLSMYNHSNVQKDETGFDFLLNKYPSITWNREKRQRWADGLDFWNTFSGVFFVPWVWRHTHDIVNCMDPFSRKLVE